MRSKEPRALSEQIFEETSRHPTGITFRDLMRNTGSSKRQVKSAIRYIRRIGMPGREKFTIDCVPNGQYKPWLYRVTAGRHLFDVEQSTYVLNRVTDYHSRGTTISGVLDTAVHDTASGTRNGRMARHVKKRFDYAVNQIGAVQTVFEFDAR